MDTIRRRLRKFCCKGRNYQIRQGYSRHGGGRYEYSMLEDDGSMQERLELEKKTRRNLARDSASLTCQYYLRSSGRYVLQEHLHDIGSRIDKSWFLVKDTSVKTERLLTLVPQSSNSPVPASATSRSLLLQLFQSLQHPYIYPVLDLDFRSLAEHTYVITVIPFNNKGSLKDLIYKSRWQDDWSEKYRERATGLPHNQVQRMGRQILEALLFLEERGYPPFAHLHSGNVIVQSGVARLAGVENSLLGYTSRIYPLIKKKIRDNREAIDPICFGHVLFEMCSGYELSVVHPTRKHLEDIKLYPQIIKILRFIFEQPDGRYPTLDEILRVDYFRNMDLREIHGMRFPEVYKMQVSDEVLDLLRDVRRFHRPKKPYYQPQHPPKEGPRWSGENYYSDDYLRCYSNEYPGADASGLAREYSVSTGNCAREPPSDPAFNSQSSSQTSSGYFTPRTSLSVTELSNLPDKEYQVPKPYEVPPPRSKPGLFRGHSSVELYLNRSDPTVLASQSQMLSNHSNDEYHTPPNTPPTALRRPQQTGTKKRVSVMVTPPSPYLPYAETYCGEPYISTTKKPTSRPQPHTPAKSMTHLWFKKT